MISNLFTVWRKIYQSTVYYCMHQFTWYLNSIVAWFMQWNKAESHWSNNILSEISGSHSNKHEDGSLLGCCAVWSGRSLPTFHKCLLHPTSGRWLITLMIGPPFSWITAQTCLFHWSMADLMLSCDTREYTSTSAKYKN
jgi:hypothetical protein